MAVLKAESAETLGKCWGLSGNHTCKRCKLYTTKMPNKLKHSRENAYFFQFISRSGLISQRRYIPFSIGLPRRFNTAGLSKKMRAMYAPIGLVSNNRMVI